ncbi:MAG TPA: hypothetical protein VNP97_03980 [Microbacterium sp.]|nr:hypothetical protein [Microbacterium sp.]
MDIAHSQHLSRISRLLLAALGVAFAWVLLSLALGASQAHADEDDRGVLGAVGTIVGGATDVVAGTAVAATDVVTDTAAAVVDVVAPVVVQVTDAVPVVAPVIEVVETGGTVVADLTGAGVVAPIVDPTLDIVRGVPVLGSVVSTLGVDSAVSTGAATLDGVLHHTATSLVGSVSEVTAPADPIGVPGGAGTVPSAPADPRGASEGPALTHSVVTTTSVPAFEALTRAALLAGVATWLSITSEPLAFASSPAGAIAAGDGQGAGILHLLPSVLQVDSVLVGPGGAGPGAWVLVALGLVVAHRAWVRRAGPENDLAPPAPVLSTDVSPD